jgi:oligoribonuclease NrnB/cAMP/cGMP phosphodiesterase (DHH superfamily)
MIKDFDIIIYHAPCSDGTGSLWSACHYKDIPEKLVCKAGHDPIGNFSNKNLLFVDICPTFDFIFKNNNVVSNIVIIDHHKSAMDMYEKNKIVLEQYKNVTFVFDITKAGCQLTWDYFFDIERPWFIDYIGDRDLWTWKLPNSKEINAALFATNTIDSYDLSKLDDLLIDSENKKIKLLEYGKIVIHMQKSEINSCVSKAVEAVMLVKDTAYNVWLGGNINTALRSDLGNVLAKKTMSSGKKPDFSATWVFDPKTNEWWVSLRGVENSPDLSVISSYFGGGGHAKASGFTIKDGKHLNNIFLIK